MDAVLEILSYVGWVLLAITILVFVHEMGHFLFAKLFNMRVDRFSVGFPPKIFGKQIGETEYVVGATPLGGYVKIAGMVDESMDTDYMQSEPEPWEFRSKPVWQRIIVISAGVIFNVILAAFIFSGLKMAYGETQRIATDDGTIYVEESSLAYDIGLRTGDQLLNISGKPYDPYSGLQSLEALMADSLTVTVARTGDTLTFEGPQDIMTQLSRRGALGIDTTPSMVGQVMPDSPAAEAGLQPGDRIVTINGREARFWVQMSEVIQDEGSEPISVTWVRPDSATATPGDSTISAMITPTTANGDGRPVIGITWATRTTEYGAGAAVLAGIGDTWSNTKLIITNLKRVITGRESFRENIGGPVMVAVVTKEAAEAGARNFWFIVAMLSITLAIVNILPIPALDGGHLVFLLYEGITRREPSLKVRTVMQQIGMVLLLTLMVFLIFNDILRL
ncbi:MAG: RIP metalloprotease RseP [Bacteroidetes bacterium]|jgi:regulator of sigma E protease|nr:RIP metalloprotease RseP [Bacteroidota bacterium]